MPNRIIKESICESDGLASCSFFAQDLYKRLITYADDYGRFNADTMIMRARLYPREYETVTEKDVVEALIELCGVNKISFYTPVVFNQASKKGIYGAFPNWKEHQRVRDSKRKCPEPDDTSVSDWYLRRFIPLEMKIRIVERDKFRCTICGKKLTECTDARRFIKLGTGMYHIDHIVPVLQGGRATMENLRLTCPECNLKRSKTFTFKNIINEQFPESGNNLQKVAESFSELPPESNPIQSESNPKENTKEKPIAKMIDEYTDDPVLKSALQDFVAMRRSMKGFTPRAMTMCLNELKKLSGGDRSTSIKIVNQSVKNGWKGFYALKKEQVIPEYKSEEITEEEATAEQIEAVNKLKESLNVQS